MPSSHTAKLPLLSLFRFLSLASCDHLPTRRHSSLSYFQEYKPRSSTSWDLPIQPKSSREVEERSREVEALATTDEVERTCEKAEEPELKMKKGKKAEVGDLVSFTGHRRRRQKERRLTTRLKSCSASLLPSVHQTTDSELQGFRFHPTTTIPLLWSCESSDEVVWGRRKVRGKRRGSKNGRSWSWRVELTGGWRRGLRFGKRRRS